MEALTPNTSALLSYFASVSEGAKAQPESLPPSAFFTMPGTDTPEYTPESSANGASVSPPEVLRPVTSDSEGEKGTQDRRKSSGGNHKRKAGHGHTVVELSEDDEDDSSDVPSGHEDKRKHASAKSAPGSARRGRKSVGEEGKPGKDNKAARRKEQNRAAQKAFRERREAKVKDLEDKIAELEAKQNGAAAENESLRSILKRLQEENVALKQSAFTFTMPVNSTSPSNNHTTAGYRPQTVKPPSPPRSTTDDSLRSLSDPMLKKTGDSPDSIVSSSTASSNTQPPVFDEINAFNAFATGDGPYMGASQFKQNGNLFPTFNNNIASNSNGPSPTNENANIQSLWESFYRGNPVQTQPALKPVTNNFGGNNLANADKMAFRDTASAQAPVAPKNDDIDWSKLADNSDLDFLDSILGIGKQTAEEPNSDNADDDFQAQLNALLNQTTGASPSAAFALPGVFSPTNYLNMSPSPLDSVSNSQSPSSNLHSISQSASPMSSGSSAPSSAAACPQPLRNPDGSEVVYVVDEAGKVLKPSELWLKMGMHNESNVDNLVIDDLCDQMRAKATCKDGQHFLSYENAAMMFKYDGSGAHDRINQRVADQNRLI